MAHKYKYVKVHQEFKRKWSGRPLYLENQKEVVALIKAVCNKYEIPLIKKLTINPFIKEFGIRGFYETPSSSIVLSDYYIPVLLHELTHHIHYIKYPNDKWPHGKKFRELLSIVFNDMADKKINIITKEKSKIREICQKIRNFFFREGL